MDILRIGPIIESGEGDTGYREVIVEMHDATFVYADEAGRWGMTLENDVWVGATPYLAEKLDRALLEWA